MDIKPVEVTRYLDGVKWPAHKDEVVAAAERNNAPQEFIDALREVERGDNEFQAPSDVQYGLRKVV